MSVLSQLSYRRPEAISHRSMQYLTIAEHQALCTAGVCHYMNGDYYEGDWQAGLRHGRGMQQCADGSNYVSNRLQPVQPTPTRQT